jgi:hypothetical protein
MTIDWTNKRFWGLSKKVLNATTLKRYVSQDESPEGFKAVPKDDVVDPRGINNVNICSKCDWRKECQKNASVPCMATSRKDGVGVVFKKIS